MAGSLLRRVESPNYSSVCLLAAFMHCVGMGLRCIQRYYGRRLKEVDELAVIQVNRKFAREYEVS